MGKHAIKYLTLSAMFLAIGLFLPFFTGQIPHIGMALLPMHLPVLLCGLICGWKYGFSIGLIMPIMRSLLFGTPPLLPMAVAMTFELAVYGLVAGFLYGRSRWQCIIALYKALLAAMVAGRLVFGAAMAVLSAFVFIPPDGAFTFKMFISGAIITAWPGIVLQLIFIPVLMVTLKRAGLVHFYREKSEAPERMG